MYGGGGKGGGGGGGKGAYYKEKYGGGGRGGGGGGGGGGKGSGGGKGKGGGYMGKGKGGGGGGGWDRDAGGGEQAPPQSWSAPASTGPARPVAEMRASLLQIDGRPYNAYRDIEGVEYDMGRFTLICDKVQSDPFAPPSRFRVRVPRAVADFPPDCYAPRTREIAFRDYLARRFSAGAKAAGADRRTEEGGWQGPKGGELLIDAPGQHVLERSAVVVTADAIEARFTVALPARGRSVLGQWAATILSETLAGVVHGALYAEATSPLDLDLKVHLDSVEDQSAARSMLTDLGLVAFVADGAVLPRRSGASDLPMKGAVPFASPAPLKVSLQLPHRGTVSGLGVRRGVSLIVGGGFHGKSTLLEALQNGVYDKVAGDGRELVVTEATACKVRAEDGRSVSGCDISPFIAELPGGKETTAFSTEDASGSTSQAAAIIESLEAGCRALLIDEDTSATNFMIRDMRMQRLVAPDKEPIRPFISRVRPLWERHGVSSIIVVGGTGDYFDVADSVVMMDSYVPLDVTERARQIARDLPAALDHSMLVPASETSPFASLLHRCPTGSGITRDAKLYAGREALRFGELPETDLSCVEQIVEHSQVRAIGQAVLALPLDEGHSVRELLGLLEGMLARDGIDALHPRWRVGNLAMPRPLEVSAALNRLRSLQIAESKRRDFEKL